MSDPTDTSTSEPMRQDQFHADVERQGLALGAARERFRLQDVLSADRERKLEEALDSWENEGGPAHDASPASKPPIIKRMTNLQLTADFFRDDTLLRALAWNGLLLVMVVATVSVLMNR